MEKEELLENSEEYDDPVLYDTENDQYLEDIPFLTKWASKSKGTIIDLACGTGRATIPLAQKGHSIIGVDVHKAMLNRGKEKTANTTFNIDWVEQDCTRLDLKTKSPFIYMVGNSFQHFLTNEEQDRLLFSVNKHLENGGIFIFNTRFPNAEELLQPPTEEYWRSYTDPSTGMKVDVSTISNYDALTQIQHYITIRRFKDEIGVIVEEKKSNIRLRYVYPMEMERTLKGKGFEILELYKDWKEAPLTSDSYQMIYVVKKVK